MDSVTVVVEQDTLTPALARLGAEADRVLKAIAKETAERIKDDAQGRLRRQTSGTGRTADAITVEEGADGYYKVTSGNMGDRPANLPIWLESGTKHMTAKPYFYGAVQLEAGTYLRRVEQAMQDAIDGLGGA